MLGERGQFHVRASKGVHLVVPRDRIHSDTGLILRTEKSVLFVIPWGRHWIIGTTDTDWNLDIAHPAASRARHRLPPRARQRRCSPSRSHDDIEGVYAGLRPLLAGESEETSAALPRARRVAAGARAPHRRRRQVHDVPRDGRDAVDAAAAAWAGARRACTHETPLVGADGYPALWNRRAGRRRARRCTSRASSTCSAATARARARCST